MNPKNLEKWAKIRAKGEWRFVLLRAILWFGIIQIGVLSISEHYFLSGGFELRSLCHKIFYWPVFGFLMAVLTWNDSEFKYARANAQAPPQTILQRIYAKGLLRFLLVIGLGGSLFTALLGALHDSIFDKYGFQLRDFITDLAIWLIIYVVFSLVAWIIFERRFQKLAQESIEEKG